MSDLAAAVDRVLPGARDDLVELVAIPSVSAEPARHGDVRRAVERLRELALAAGAAEADVVSADGGAPALIATWPAPEGAPTVLLYAHADVQPTGPLAEWTSPPFEATERDGRLYGRGAADDKAGALLHLAVLRAYDGRPPVGVVLFVEGEEEVGSPTFTALLAEQRDRLEADVIVVADAGNAAVDVPSLTTSLRGLVELVVDVRMLERPVHSGMFGGPVVDALTVLCRLVATLHDQHGDVAVAGLHASTSEELPEEDEPQFAAEAGLLPGVELVGSGTIPDRLWHRPAIAVLGIDAPAVAEASNVLLPRARVKLSVRIAPGDTAERALTAVEAHLRTHVPWGAHLVLERGPAGEPYELTTAGPVYDLARTTFAEAYDKDVVEIGIGGSIPFIAEFVQTFPAATVLVTGVGDPASRWHGIDESLDLGMWRCAILAEALLLQRLAGSV